MNTPPTLFPIGNDFKIETGLSVREIADKLTEENIIRSPHYFYFVFTHEFPDSFAQAGTYQFSSPKTTREVISSITSGRDQSPALKVTFPEGFRARDIGEYLPDQFLPIPTETVVPYEGYLFPDTYFIKADTDLEALLTQMQQNFVEKLKPFQEKIAQTSFTERDVIILASIIEREGKDIESKKLVSGILQNRLEIGMPLQVDASFDYLFDKTSAEVTSIELDHDSLFNSYLYTGLPPAPIANPGLESIEAVLEPTPSEFLYYLTGDDGVFYYAKTFEQHKVHKSRYLRP